MSNNLEAVVWKHEYGFDEAITTNDDGTVTVVRSGWQGTELTAEQIATAVSEYAVYKAIMDEIERLESEVTQRRLRDAYADSTWMDAQEAKIAVERAKL